MRICVVSINYEPEKLGIAPYTTGMAVGFAGRGHDVTVLTGLPHYPEWSVHPDYRNASRTVVSNGGVLVRRYAHYVPKNPTMMRRMLFEASFGVRVASGAWAKPDIVLVTSPSLIASAMVIGRARAMKIPVGVIVQDSYGKGVAETGAMGGRKAAMVERVEAAVLNQATGIAVVHERFVDTLAAEGVDPKRLAVIRNWAHLNEPIAALDTAQVRRRYGWESDRIVLHTGNMGAKQGLENVVDAARIADQRGLGVRFVLVGNGSRRRVLEKYAQGVERIEFKDVLDAEEYRAVLAAVDVLLVNERPGVGQMAAPSKLTSYFSAGRPVLAATDANGVAAQEIQDSGAGVVVPAGEPAALLEAATKLANDREEAKRLGATGVGYARRILGAERAIDHYDEWVHRLVALSAR